MAPRCARQRDDAQRVQEVGTPSWRSATEKLVLGMNLPKVLACGRPKQVIDYVGLGVFCRNSRLVQANWQMPVF